MIHHNIVAFGHACQHPTIAHTNDKIAILVYKKTQCSCAKIGGRSIHVQH